MGINSSRPTQNTVAPAPTMNLMQHEIVDLGESVAITTGTLIPVDIIASVTGREPGILSLSQSPIRTARNRGSQAIEPAQPRQSCQLDTSDEEELELASTSAIRNALKSPNKVKEKLRNTNEVQMPGRAFEMTVVWCDDQVHDTHENIEMQKKLLEVSKSLTVQSIFNDYEDCEEHIRQLGTADEVILIVAGRIGGVLVPLVHDSTQLSAICIYAMAANYYTKKFNGYNKVAVIVGGQELIEHIQFVQNSHSKAIEDGLSLNIYNRKDGYQSESNTSFMWTYLFMEVLLHMKLLDSSSSLPNQLRSVDEKEELLIKLRKKYADDEQCFKMIEEFAATYSSDHAVWWYTRDSPFYEELNKALRYRNLELLFLLRFFIVDIFQQLKTKCEQQRAEQQQHDGHSRRISTLLVYRGQLISSKEMGNLTHSTGEFVSTNAFMSATLKESVAREFLDKSPEDPSQASKSILFEIEITPYVKTRAFAKISTLSEYGAEDEVLFVPGTIFRIQKIYNEKKTNEVKIIKLTLCSKDDQDLKGLLNHWRQHIGYETNLASFGWLIMQSGQVDKALEFYRKLLKRLSPDDPLVKYCYNGVGVLYQNRKDYKDAIDCHKEALDIALETQDEPKWCAQGYSALADVYLLNGEPDRALELYQKALPIYSNEYGTEHRDTVKCYTKIGDVYQGKEDYSAAANSYKEALKRHRQLKPRSKDPLYLITSLTNLAQIYYMIGDYQSALTNYDEALTIYLRRSRSNDPKLGILYEDIGHVHRKRKEFPLALLSFHRAAEIFYYSYPGIDEHNIRIRKAIGYCNKKLRLKQVITENCQNGPLLAEPPTSPVLFSPLTYSPHQAISGKHSKDVTGTGIEEFDKNSTINKTLRTGTANEEELHPSGDRTVTTLISNRQQIHKKNPRIVDAESKPNLSQHRRIDSRRN